MDYNEFLHSKQRIPPACGFDKAKEQMKSIAYSKINKAFPYINSLDLTPEQKTALAVACGWGLKTVNKNKLW